MPKTSSYSSSEKYGYHLSNRCRLTYDVFMITSSNGNIFRVTGPLCGEFTGDRWIPLTKASDAQLWWANGLNKQSRRWWFETLSCSLWHHCNVEFTRHWCRSSLFDGTWPFTEPTVTYNPSRHRQQISMKLGTKQFFLLNEIPFLNIIDKMASPR